MLRTKIIAFSGKKQSGKDGLGRFLAKNARYLFGPDKDVGILGFGYPMKEMAHQFFGVPKKLLFGTDADKETLTDFNWEGLPHYNNIDFMNFHFSRGDGHLPHGKMTVRQLLQEIGESMFLKMYPNIWIDYTEQQLIKTKSDIVCFIDPRKPEQIKALKDWGATVIRLMRNNDSKDDHISETALDKDKFDWSHFDYVLDNRNMTVEQRNQSLAYYLYHHDFCDCAAYHRDDKRIDWSCD